MNFKRSLIAVLMSGIAGTCCAAGAKPAPPTYCVVDTGQVQAFSDSGQLPRAPRPGEPFFGQDACYQGPQPGYRDNGDGTISDLNTGLTWVKARGEKVTWNDAVAGAARCRVGGCTDWRAPTIKELYSLINFRGGCHPEGNSVPYLDTRYFEFKYGDTAAGERVIDCQDWSATTYVGTTMRGNLTAFGVNFADGRIKGYPKAAPGPGGITEKKLYVRYVRGNPDYGKNDFHDNGDGTIADRATGLMWAKADSGKAMNWQEALAWVQEKNKENYLGHNDWRLPSAKELQSIVDYTRAPQAADQSRRGPAIDPAFQVTKLPDGDYPFFWTGTTHLDGPLNMMGCAAVYVAFGRATGWMQPRFGGGPPGMGGPGPGGPPGGGFGGPGPRGPGPGGPPGSGPQASGSDNYQLLDVHGAGAQRSDPKKGDPATFPHGRGPQGDVVRIYNYVRAVRSIDPASVRLVLTDPAPRPAP